MGQQTTQRNIASRRDFIQAVPKLDLQAYAGRATIHIDIALLLFELSSHDVIPRPRHIVMHESGNLHKTQIGTAKSGSCRPAPAAIAILLRGIASFAIVPPLQMQVMEAASDAPNLASAMNIGAFNLGNAVGAALGGAVISAGLWYPAVSIAGAATAASALAFVLLLRRRTQRLACPAE